MLIWLLPKTCSGYSDDWIVAWALASCGLYTTVNVMTEVVFKLTMDQWHNAKARSWVWFGAEPDQFTPTPWLSISFIGNIAVYAIALIIYRVLKVRLRVPQGIVPASQNTRVESSANGMTNVATVIAMILFLAVFIATVVGRLVKEALTF